MDNIIIGGGPAGLSAAAELCKKGFSAKVYEEDKQIGKPVQCTGIVTRDILKETRLDDNVILNKLQKAIIHSPGNETELKLKDLVIDRAAFDKQMGEMARSEGAKVFLNKRVSGLKKTKNGFFLDDKINKNAKNTKSPNNQNYHNYHNYQNIIAANGPASSFRELINPNLKLKYLTGKQAIIKGTFDAESFHVYFGNDFPGFFGWIVPESENTARVGLATGKNPGEYFEKFLQKINLNKKNIKEYNAGLIPIYEPGIKTQRKNLFLLGDAAGQVKATTGGGIVPGLKASKCLAKSIAEEKSYEKFWRKKIGAELYMHQKIRKSLDTFTNKDYDSLIELLRKSKKTLEEGSRDSMIKMLPKIALKNPGLIRFIKNIRI